MEYRFFRYKYLADFVLNLEESLGLDEKKPSPISTWSLGVFAVC